jgi:DegV family protein with EDD domain
MIKIITDSTSDLPENIVSTYNIKVIPLRLFIGSEEYKDGVDMSPNEFYEKMRSSNDFPRTESPQLNTFTDVYETHMNTHEQLISIHLSEKMSSTIKIARQAKEKLNVNDDRLVVIDSKSASFGLGIQVIELAERCAGKERLTPEEIEEFEREVVGKNRVIFGVTHLDFLKRGGRLGAAEKLVGSLAGQKAVLAIENGEIIALGKVKNKQEFPTAIFDYMKEHMKEKKKIIAGVFHWRSQEEAEVLEFLIKGYFDCRNIYTSVAGSVIGSHTGYGPVGVTYYPV